MQTHQHTFNKVEIYQYFCILHEGTTMDDWIIVIEK